MRKLFSAMLAAVVISGAVGCTKGDAEKATENRSSKRPSMPARAILGEWSGEGATYFIKEAPGKHLIITTVSDKGRVFDTEYAITSENSKDRVLELHQWLRKERDETKSPQSEMGDQRSWPHFQFSEDMKTVDVKRTSGSGELRSDPVMADTITYVSDRTDP